MTSALAHCLAALAELFPHPPMTDARLAAFGVSLADLTPAECERAFLVLSRERDRKFYPSPGEILEAARPSATAAGVAMLFGRIEAAIFFRHATLSAIAAEFGVAAMEAVQAAGGLEAIRSPGEYRALRLAEFTRAYRETVAVEPEKVLPPAADESPKAVLALVRETGRGMALPSGDR